MLLTYDDEADVLYVQFKDQTGESGSRDFGGGRFFAFDGEGPMAVKFLAASEGIDLDGLPAHEQIREGLDGPRQLLGSKVKSSAA